MLRLCLFKDTSAILLHICHLLVGGLKEKAAAVDYGRHTVTCSRSAYESLWGLTVREDID